VPGEPVVGGQTGHKRLGEQGLQLQPRRRCGGAQEPGVDPPGGQRGQLLIIEAFADRDPNRRVCVTVGPDDQGER
jgi:hypothetical protein